MIIVYASNDFLQSIARAHASLGVILQEMEGKDCPMIDQYQWVHRELDWVESQIAAARTRLTTEFRNDKDRSH